jgi:hypothetical protein
LIVELEDRVDAVSKLIAEINEFRGDDEDGTDGEKEEDK